MKKADFGARIKRIEIINKAFKNQWRQVIRVVLDDIALTDGNFLELRQFRPHESVIVTIEPAELPAEGNGGEYITPLAEFSEEAAVHQGRVLKTWNFKNV